MIKFQREWDKKNYDIMLGYYNEWEKRGWNIKEKPYIRVRDFGNNLKCFEISAGLGCWFYGTWEDLREQLKKDFPKMYTDKTEFYLFYDTPGIFI